MAATAGGPGNPGAARGGAPDTVTERPGLTCASPRAHRLPVGPVLPDPACPAGAVGSQVGLTGPGPAPQRPPDAGGLRAAFSPSLPPAEPTPTSAASQPAVATEREAGPACRPPPRWPRTRHLACSRRHASRSDQAWEQTDRQTGGPTDGAGHGWGLRGRHRLAAPAQPRPQLVEEACASTGGGGSRSEKLRDSTHAAAARPAGCAGFARHLPRR